MTSFFKNVINSNNLIVQALWIFGLCILTRLHVLTGIHSHFDGDEAVIGIMAQDLIALKNVPFYFYGQQYGFSFFEVFSTSIFLLIFGASSLSLKLGALLVWSLGALAFWRLFKALNWSNRRSLFGLFCILLFPGWFIFSMKARGGYVTAFACLSWIIYIIQRPKNHKYDFVAIAGLNAILFVAQPLWFVIGFPLSMYYIWRQSARIKQISLFLLSSAVFVLILRLPATLNANIWNPSILSNKLILNLEQWGIKVWSGLSNFFYFGLDMEVPKKVSLSIILFLFLALYGVFKLKKQFETWILLICGIFLVVLPAFANIPDSRYFLPFGTVVLLLVILTLIKSDITNQWSHLNFYFIGMLFLLGVTPFRSMPAHWHSPEVNDDQMVFELKEAIEERNCKHVLSTDHAIFYKIIYLSNQKINARYLSKIDRLQPAADAVTTCYHYKECKTLLIGLVGMWNNLDYIDSNWNKTTIQVNARYYIQPELNTEHLKESGFEF